MSGTTTEISFVWDWVEIWDADDFDPFGFYRQQQPAGKLSEAYWPTDFPRQPVGSHEILPAIRRDQHCGSGLDVNPVICFRLGADLRRSDQRPQRNQTQKQRGQ